MPIRAPQKVKQQRRVLLLALYLLKHRYNEANPPKRQVLNFISLRHLMHVPADDSDLRSTGDEIWENDLAWRRADLKTEEFIEGDWQITTKGEAEVESWARRVKELTDADPRWTERFKFDPTDDLCDFEFYVTPNTYEWALKIATGTLNLRAS